MRFDALLFDFDGVLIDSEYLGNRQIADLLTVLGHPTTPEQSMASFMGLAGHDFITAVERHIGGPLPAEFHARRQSAEARAIADGVEAVAGAVAFVRGLPASLPIAVVSSSPTRWISAHLRHIGLEERFGARIFSGREHVSCGKPAPDLYFYAADALGVPIARCAVVEDSPVGVTGAAASGAFVIGLCAGRHCALGHDEILRGRGAAVIATTFDEVAAALSE